MKKTWANGLLKTLAFLLAVVSVTVTLVGAVGTLFCLEGEVYARTRLELREDVTQNLALSLANDIADYHAQETVGTPELMHYRVEYDFYKNPEDTSIRYKIKDEKGKTLVSNYRGQTVRGQYELVTNPGFYAYRTVYEYGSLWENDEDFVPVTSPDLWAATDHPEGTIPVVTTEPEQDGPENTNPTTEPEQDGPENTDPTTEPEQDEPENTDPTTEPDPTYPTEVTAPTSEQENTDPTWAEDTPPEETTEPVVDRGEPAEPGTTYPTEPALSVDTSGRVLTGSYQVEAYVHLDEQWTVTVYVLEELVENDIFSNQLRAVDFLYDMKTCFPVTMVVGLLVTVLLVVYLLCAAGHRPGKEEIIRNPFDKIPLDLYLAVVTGGVVALVALACEVVDWFNWWYYDTWYQTELYLAIGALAAGTMGAATLILAFFMSFATRLKQGEGYVWRHTVIFWCLKLAWKFLKLVGRGIRFLFRAVVRLFRLLPLVWQWGLLTLGLMFFTLLFMVNYAWGGVFCCILLWLGLSVYLAYGFGSLRQAARDMAGGNLERRVSTRFLFGHFRLMAEDLNRLGSGAAEEVERRMRSERMKTELITNVSHDIKTPLTSIVSYVDLLQKPHTPQEQEEYLEVLARQAQKLKKLTEDLVEMSKASSGNLTVNPSKTNVVELINQAIAEYESKMEDAHLSVLKKVQEGEVFAWADGRLFWRVLDNLLGNCVKYAMPGTRLYVDITRGEGHVQVSVKNISREPLNIPAQELMERFVRGDRSRNTEGSGLGLNIARSLMELQGGTLELAVDGDLFKVILTLKEEA